MRSRGSIRLLSEEFALISPQDARDFCVVAAQVIPTLIIALFVVNRVFPTKLKDIGGREEAVELLEEIGDTRALIVEAAEKTQALIESTVDLRERVSLQQRLRKLASFRDRVEGQEGKVQSLEARREDVKKASTKLSASMRSLSLAVSIYAAVTFILGIVAEWLTLAGLLKVVEYRTAAKFATNAIIILTCALATESWRGLVSIDNNSLMDTKTGKNIAFAISIIIAVAPLPLILIVSFKI